MSTVTDSNPLLEVRSEVPFDRVRAEHVEPAAQVLLEHTKRHLETIAAVSDPRSYDNTMRALDEMTDRLDYAVGVVRHLESVATYPELRTAYNAIEPLTSAFYSSIPLHEGLWRAIRAYSETSEAQALNGTRRRFLAKTIDSFRRHGAGLEASGKARLQEIDVELAQLTTRFSQNVLDATNAFELVIEEEARLAGLPETARAAARESAAAKGRAGWRFTLQAPSYVPALTYLDDAVLRRALYEAYNRRAAHGEHDNRAILTRILELRRAKAALLGFQDFSDFALADRMAQRGERAQQFLNDLRDKTTARFEQENEDLTAFRRSLEGPDAPRLAPWDVAYYAEKQRQALYDFDEEALRPYFPVDQVVAGLFEVATRLYGLRIVEQSGLPVWDPAVKCYGIYNGSGDRLLGTFYADWYPRENKRGGAWMDGLLTGVIEGARHEPHVGVICGNLTPPTSDRPALLTHREVETIFHEFGHLMHHCLSTVEVRSLAGTNVAWDFVELPSQIMENWCWERGAVDLFARHYQTGEPIPEELFQKMNRARTFRAANAQMRQLGFGFVDLALHREYSPERDGDPVAYSRALLQQFSAVPLPEDHAMILAFTHLFANSTGYAAGYYSYKWSEVLDADAFTRFRREGVFSRETGLAFRNTILARGDSADPGDLYRTFMGRDPDLNPLLERLGLL